MKARIPGMGSGYGRLFSMLTSESVPVGLEERIMRTIRARHARTVRLRVFGASLSGVVSGIGCFFGIRAFVQAAAESGFFSYLGLFLSDGSTMLRNATVFAFSLLESLPALETTFLLAIVAALGASLYALAVAAPEYRRLSGAFN